MEKIDSLRIAFPEYDQTFQKEESDFNYSSLLSIIFAFLGIVISLFGAYSTVLKAKSERQIEISELVRTAVDFENLVVKIIEGFGYKTYRETHSAFAPDLIVDSPKGKVAVEIKYSASKLSSDVVNSVRSVAVKYSGRLLLITNAHLSHEADQQIQIHEMSEDFPIDIIQASDKVKLIKKIEDYFKGD